MIQRGRTSDGNYVVELTADEIYFHRARELVENTQVHIWMNPDGAEDLVSSLFKKAKRRNLAERERKVLCLLLQSMIVDLDPIQRKVLDLRFGLSGKKHSVKEIGELLGESEPYWAHKPIAKAMRFLRHPLRWRELREFADLMELDAGLNPNDTLAIISGFVDDQFESLNVLIPIENMATIRKKASELDMSPEWLVRMFLIRWIEEI